MSVKVQVDQSAWEKADALAKEAEFLKSAEQWENRELGADEKFVRVSPVQIDSTGSIKK